MTTQSRSELSLEPALAELCEMTRLLLVDVASGTLPAHDARAMVSRWALDWRATTGRPFPLRWHTQGSHSAARRASVTMTREGWRWRTYHHGGSLRAEGMAPTEEAAKVAADLDLGVSDDAFPT